MRVPESFLARYSEPMSPAPTRQRMNAHAIAVLEEAQLIAQDQPIAPSAGVRLALSWLTLNKVAQGWQVEAFWKALTKPIDSSRHQADYMRRRDMQIYIDAWKRAAGFSLNA